MVSLPVNEEERVHIVLKLDLIEIEVRKWHASRSSRAAAIRKHMDDIRMILYKDHPHISIIEKMAKKTMQLFDRSRHDS